MRPCTTWHFRSTFLLQDVFCVCLRFFAWYSGLQTDGGETLLNARWVEIHVACGPPLLPHIWWKLVMGEGQRQERLAKVAALHLHACVIGEWERVGCTPCETCGELGLATAPLPNGRK